MLDEGAGEETPVPSGLGHDNLEDKLVPTLVVILHQLGVRVGRCLSLQPLHALSFDMGTHRRLGTGVEGLGLEGNEGNECADRHCVIRDLDGNAGGRMEFMQGMGLP